MFKNIFKKKHENKDDKDILITSLLIHAAKIDYNYTIKEKEIIKKALIDALNNNIRKIDLFTKTYQPIEVEFTSSIDQFFNINTPEDLEIAKKIFEESKI